MKVNERTDACNKLKKDENNKTKTLIFKVNNKFMNCIKIKGREEEEQRVSFLQENGANRSRRIA